MKPEVTKAIKSLLADKNICQPIRIELSSSGCCDSALHLRIDTISDGDLRFESDGLIFVIDPATYQLVGEVTIAYVNKPGRKGFVITSSKPTGEWDGFGASEIKF